MEMLLTIISSNRLYFLKKFASKVMELIESDGEQKLHRKRDR